MSEGSGADVAADRLLGTYAENTIDALRSRLFDLNLIPTPWSPLESVLVEDYHHYLDLLHAAGIHL